MKLRWEWRDLTTRVLFVISGVVAGILLVMNGELEALPGLALGGMLGACLVRRIAPENH